MNALSRFASMTKRISAHPLNRDHRYLAVLNYVLWRIGTILIGKRVEVSWVEDARFIAGNTDAGLIVNLYTGFAEYEDMVFLLHALRPTMKFVDVGANTGAYTILASKVVKAKSIAFEPLPETFERLRDQIQINRIEDYVDARNLGVGDRVEVLQFTNSSDSMNKVNLSDDSTNTSQVRVVTLDSCVSTRERLFLKMDVEGYEFNVIQGAHGILSSDNLVGLIIELNGSGEQFGHSDQEIHDKLVSYGLIPIRYEPFNREIKKLQGYDKGRDNTIYIKNLEFVEALCREAPRRVVHTAWNTSI